jgi:hypothetical protein
VLSSSRLIKLHWRVIKSDTCSCLRAFQGVPVVSTHVSIYCWNFIKLFRNGSYGNVLLKSSFGYTHRMGLDLLVLLFYALTRRKYKRGFLLNNHIRFNMLNDCKCNFKYLTIAINYFSHGKSTIFTYGNIQARGNDHYMSISLFVIK